MTPYSNFVILAPTKPLTRVLGINMFKNELGEVYFYYLSNPQDYLSFNDSKFIDEALLSSIYLLPNVDRHYPLLLETEYDLRFNKWTYSENNEHHYGACQKDYSYGQPLNSISSIHNCVSYEDMIDTIDLDLLITKLSLEFYNFCTSSDFSSLNDFSDICSRTKRLLYKIGNSMKENIFNHQSVFSQCNQPLETFPFMNVCDKCNIVMKQIEKTFLSSIFTSLSEYFPHFNYLFSFLCNEVVMDFNDLRISNSINNFIVSDFNNQMVSYLCSLIDSC